MADCGAECKGHCLRCCHGACPVCCTAQGCEACILWMTGQWAAFWWSVPCTCEKMACKSAAVWIVAAYLGVIAAWAATLRSILDRQC